MDCFSGSMCAPDDFKSCSLMKNTFLGFVHKPISQKSRKKNAYKEGNLETSIEEMYGMINNTVKCFPFLYPEWRSIWNNSLFISE